MRRFSRIALLGTALVLGACSDRIFPSPDLLARSAAQPGASVNVEGFYWLPPMVADPGPFTGAFDATRSPTARIVCTGASGAGCPELAHFDATTPAESRLTVDIDGQNYRALWRSTASVQLGTGHYRIEVREGQALLGQADLHVVASQKEARTVSAANIALVRGLPFLIKFRLESASQPTPLPGNPDDPAASAIILTISPPDGQNFQTGHPDLPGLPTSVNDAIVHVEPNATIRQINTALNAVAGQIVGGIPGVGGSVPGMLVVRFTTTTHAGLAAVLEQLRAQPGIAGAMADAQLTTDALPTASTPIPGGGLAPWDWKLSTGGNWGFYTASVTQMWNFNDWVSQFGTLTRVGVLDEGFVAHDDVPVLENVTPDAALKNHGTNVASVIGAAFGNGVGIDGVNPYARLRTHAHVTSISNIATTMTAHVQQFADEPVLNMSMGYNWYSMTPAIDADNTPAARNRASFDGVTFRNALQALAAQGRPLPVITVSAGNNSNKNGWAWQQSIHSSPLTNAALAQGAAPIIVVEAMNQDFQRAGFTNIGGHVMAPGDAMLVADSDNGYKSSSGTSLAAPFVAGVVSYLYSAASDLPRPSMTVNPIRDLLVRTAQAVDESPTPFVNAFRALLDVDRLRGNDRLLRAMLDVDDGSGDGNLRVNAFGTVVTSTDFDGNGRTGDGEIDMSDFRRFRDHLLDVQSNLSDFTGVLFLNGGPTHPKRDLNGDKVISEPTDERSAPKLDFNGDGVLHESLTATMSGALNGQELSDLGVLQSRFVDAHYTAGELTDLLLSADVTFNLTTCFAREGVSFVKLRARRQNTQAVVHERVALANAQVQIVTVPYSSSGIDFEIDLLAADGTTRIARYESFAPAELGQDSFVTPACLTSVSVSPANQSIVAGTTQQFAATVTGNPNTAVTWSATGGTISSSGLYTAGSTAGTFTVTATSAGDPSVSATVNVGITSAQQPPPTPSTDFQIVSGALAGKFTTPIRYRSRITNIPGRTVQFTTVATRTGIGPAIDQTVLTLTENGPVVVDEYRVDWFAEVAFPVFWQGSTTVGIKIATTACWFQPNGSPVLNASGQPLCATRETLY